MDEEAIKAEMRLYALELIVSVHYASLIIQQPAPLAALDKLEAQIVEKAKMQTFKGLDPAFSDLASAELEAALTRLIAMQRQFVASHPKAAG